MFEANYRVQFLFNLVGLLLPPLATAWVLFLTAIPSNLPHVIIFRRMFFCAVCITYWTAKVQYQLYKKRSEAKRLGVSLPPEPRGRWIGNIDLIIEYVPGMLSCSVSPHYNGIAATLKTITKNLPWIMWKPSSRNSTRIRSTCAFCGPTSIGRRIIASCNPCSQRTLNIMSRAQRTSWCESLQIFVQDTKALFRFDQNGWDVW